jgi:hypothetical protein
MNKAFFMKFSEACNFLNIPINSEYSHEDINKIWKNGMRKYHPDKRFGEDTSLVKNEYDKFIEAIEVLRRGNDTIIAPFDVVSKYTNMIIQQVIITGCIPNKPKRKILKKTETQKIGFIFTSYELFAKTTKTEKINVAVEGSIIHIDISFTPTPLNTTQMIPNLGHKNYGEERGDIEMFVKIIDPPSAKWKYDTTTQILTMYRSKSTPPKVIILPCDTIISINDSIFHPVFTSVRIVIEYLIPDIKYS